MSRLLLMMVVAMVMVTMVTPMMAVRTRHQDWYTEAVVVVGGRVWPGRVGDVDEAVAAGALVATAGAGGVTDAALAEDTAAILAADVDGGGGLRGAVEH